MKQPSLGTLLYVPYETERICPFHLQKIYLQNHTFCFSNIRPLGREPDLLKKLREQTASMPERNMQILPEQGQFLTMLVKIHNPKNILESIAQNILRTQREVGPKAYLFSCLTESNLYHILSTLRGNHA